MKIQFRLSVLLVTTAIAALVVNNFRLQWMLSQSEAEVANVRSRYRASMATFADETAECRRMVAQAKAASLVARRREADKRNELYLEMMSYKNALRLHGLYTLREEEQMMKEVYGPHSAYDETTQQYLNLGLDNYPPFDWSR